MRISQDDTSWKAGGVKRRDFRHDPSQPERERYGSKKKAKNKRKVDAAICRNGGAHRFSNLKYYYNARCRVCGVSYWQYYKDMKKRRQAEKKIEEIAQHKEDGLTSHLFVWQPIDEKKKVNCDCLYWHDFNCPNRDSSFWRDSYNRKAFNAGKKIVVYEHVCVSCGHVDKTKNVPDGEQEEWGVE